MKTLLSPLIRLCRTVPLSLRWQMVLWYTIAFTVLLVGTGAVFYQYLENRLEDSVDTDLQLRAQQIATGAVISHGTVSLRNVTGDLSSNVSTGVLVRLLDTRGQVQTQTPAFRQIVVPVASITAPSAGTLWQGTITAPNGGEVRITSQAITSGGKTVAILQVGESLAHLHILLHQLVAALLLVGAAVLLCCAAGSYWLAGYSISPLVGLAETARKIKGGDLRQRLPVPAIRDEVHYLAVTLNEMLDALEQAFSRERRFVADASHELRTPVAVIRNTAAVALLVQPQLDETVTALREIHSETERLTELLTDLLMLARGDEGQTRFEQEVLQFDRLVETVAETTEGLAAERNIQLAVQIPHPVQLLGDEARLIQVVMNLLDNAIRYTNPGGWIRVSIEQMGDWVELSVQDSGIGIAPRHLPHVFERFYRADPTRRRAEGSNSGLGLSIVEWIVHAHGGSVSVESQADLGSCFIVRLPLKSLSGARA